MKTPTDISPRQFTAKLHVKADGEKRHLQHIDFQRLFSYKNALTFTGKEKDSETGFYYFGARYYDPSISGLFLSVDPMADKYPSTSPYAYCAWNPVKLVDPDGKEYGDFYDRKGNYLGWDGIRDNYVYIISERSDIKLIKANNKAGRTTNIDCLNSAPILKTSYNVLREACNVLDRAEVNSGQTIEEGSVIDSYFGIGLRGESGESNTVVIPSTPSWICEAVSIHSHNKDNDARQMSGNRGDRSGDADNFGKFTLNIIVGPLGVGGENGLCFYPSTSTKREPFLEISRNAAEKIICQSNDRIKKALEKQIDNL